VGLPVKIRVGGTDGDTLVGSAEVSMVGGLAIGNRVGGTDGGIFVG